MSRDTSFYYSFLVLPPRKRRAIVAVWDFCRAVDDAVDDAGSASPSAGVAFWRSELTAVYDRRSPPVTAQGRALQPFVREFNLPQAEFERLIDGVEMDIGRVCYPTFDALAEYCRRVAGTVGLICLEIFGYRDERARGYALDLAMALQLTNIIRDVGVDLRQGRVYLPIEDLRRFEVSEREFSAGVLTPHMRSLLEFECRRARDYYRRAAAALPAADRRRLVAAEIMGGIYAGILQRIERAGYDVFSRRIRVPRPQRMLIALTIWVRSWAW